MDFPDPRKTDIYKLDLQLKIMETVKACPYALFIFDEIDKMPEGLVDAVKAFIDFHESVQGLDFRKAIFIFLSNTGGKEINHYTFQAWQKGRQRSSLQYKELKLLVERGAFNEIGGLHLSSVIDKHLVDWFVPFLPLERKHVASCIVAEANDRNSSIVLKNEEIDSILDEMVYFPKEYMLFASTGCKTISSKVDMLLYNILGGEGFL